MPQVKQGLTDRTQSADNAREKVRSDAFKALSALLDLAERLGFHGEAVLKVHHNHGSPQKVKKAFNGEFDN